MSTEKIVQVEGKTLKLTNLDKVLYPKVGFTKAHILDYYTKISPHLLPHLRHRMLTLKRYPEGVDGMFFYEKRCPSYKPAWMKTKRVKSERGGADIPYCEIDHLPGILWVANLASLELHVLLSTTKNIERPTMVVFDLDPGPGCTLVDCCKLAIKIRKVLQNLKLECFPKTSGGKGLHLYIPLNTAVHFDQTKLFAREVAIFFEKKYPEEVTSNMKKITREGKIFMDWSQNDSHKTTVCVYSLRAREKPYVSTPLTWNEVENCAKSKNEPAYKFTTEDVLKRVKKLGDLFEPVLKLKQKLPAFKN